MRAYLGHDIVEVVGVQLERQGVFSPGGAQGQQARVLRVAGNDLVEKEASKQQDEHKKQSPLGFWGVGRP